MLAQQGLSGNLATRASHGREFMELRFKGQDLMCLSLLRERERENKKRKTEGERERERARERERESRKKEAKKETLNPKS